jgi:integrase/recombinase XerD
MCKPQKKSTMKTKTIEDFRAYLMQIGYKKGTQTMLPICLNEFLNFVNKSVSSIDKTDILSYYEYIKNRPNKRRPGALSESMVNHHVFSLKIFFSFQMEIGKITVNPMDSLTFPRPKSKAREILTPEEITHLFDNCETHREKAVLSIFYGLGLRRSEGENLLLEDVNFKTSLLVVREGKGKKRRVIPMNKAISESLKNYVLKERKATSDTKTFFTSRIGLKMSGNALNKILKQLLERAGIEKEISLHCLRHSIATHLLENGLSLEYVRDFLGHQHLETTQIYTRVKNKQLWNLLSSS